MSVCISPSILSADFANLERDIKKVGWTEKFPLNIGCHYIIIAHIVAES